MTRRVPNPTSAVLAFVFLVTLAGSAGATRYSTGDDFTVKRSDLRMTSGGSYVESIDMLFDVEQGGVLILGTSHGSVAVRTWPYAKVRMVVSKSASVDSEIDARRIFDMFRVQALRGGADLKFTARARTAEAAENVGVTFTIWVPRSYNVDIKTKSGNIELPELGGRFSAHTSDGRISVDCDPEDVDIEVDRRDAAAGGDTPAEVRPRPEHTSGEKPLGSVDR